MVVCHPRWARQKEEFPRGPFIKHPRQRATACVARTSECKEEKARQSEERKQVSEYESQTIEGNLTRRAYWDQEAVLPPKTTVQSTPLLPRKCRVTKIEEWLSPLAPVEEPWARCELFLIRMVLCSNVQSQFAERGRRRGCPCAAFFLFLSARGDLPALRYLSVCDAGIQQLIWDAFGVCLSTERC